VRRLVAHLRWVLGRAARGMAQSPVVQLLAIATTSVCMLLLGVVLLVFQHARGVADAWGLDVPITVVLAEDAKPEAVDELVGKLVLLDEIVQVERISPEVALRRLADGLGEDASAVEGLDPTLLPTTLEISLRTDVDPSFAPRLGEKLTDLALVDDVVLLGDWVARIKDFLTTFGAIALGMGMLVSFAATAIVWSTIRLSVYSRRTELDILRLVGGTPWFVRAPFVVEGVVQGLLGTALALGVLRLGFQALTPHLEHGLSLVLASGALRFFSPVEIGCWLAFGATLGLVGARTAVNRHAEV
jgi:cell division transport system permease protein